LHRVVAPAAVDRQPHPIARRVGERRGSEGVCDAVHLAFEPRTGDLEHVIARAPEDRQRIAIVAPHLVGDPQVELRRAAGERDKIPSAGDCIVVDAAGGPFLLGEQVAFRVEQGDRRAAAACARCFGRENGIVSSAELVRQIASGQIHVLIAVENQLTQIRGRAGKPNGKSAGVEQHAVFEPFDRQPARAGLPESRGNHRFSHRVSPRVVFGSRAAIEAIGCWDRESHKRSE